MKVTASMSVVSLTATAIYHLTRVKAGGTTLYAVVESAYIALFYVLVPVSVLVMNVVVVREVRRASINAAVNLGLQQHHQSTSSNSAVPTVMLVTTSLVYVLLCGTWSVIYIVWWMPGADVVDRSALQGAWSVSFEVHNFIYCYNFYVYLATGKQFRCELHKLFCRCRSAAEAAGVPTGHTHRVDTPV